MDHSSESLVVVVDVAVAVDVVVAAVDVAVAVDVVVAAVDVVDAAVDVAVDGAVAVAAYTFWHVNIAGGLLCVTTNTVKKSIHGVLP